MHHRSATDERAIFEIGGLIIRATVLYRGPHTLLKNSRARRKLTAETHPHQTYTLCIHIGTALKIVDGIAHWHFIIMAQREGKFHLTLTWPIDGQHRHAAPQKILAIEVQFFLHRVQTRNQDDYRRFSSVPGLSEDAIHGCAILIGDRHPS